VLAPLILGKLVEIVLSNNVKNGLKNIKEAVAKCSKPGSIDESDACIA
jgi:hypothetical protein